MLKSLLILFSLVLGLLVPAAGAAQFLVRPFLMVLLFFSFLGVELNRDIFDRRQGWVALLLLPIGLGAFALGNVHSPELGWMLFVIAIAPTAIISPVLADIMRRRAGYLIGSILVTHGAVALILPLLIPVLSGQELRWAALLQLFTTILSTVLGPLLAAQLPRRYMGRWVPLLLRINPYVFILFLSNIFIASANLSQYIQYESALGWSVIALAGGGIFTLGLANFGLGALIAPAGLEVEGSLALGRKNTMLAIWIALAFIGPAATLGPMLYILFQNLFNAGQIAWLDRKYSRTGASPDK